MLKGDFLLLWTLRESDSHLVIANDACYHYTKGPINYFDYTCFFAIFQVL